MTDFINRDELRENMLYAMCGTGYQSVALAEIDLMPSVDAEQVLHGKWIDMDEQSYTWKVRCSVCGHERSMLSTQGEYPNYCENCGAKMDEERKEEC